ncbi:hypothetical protein MMC27_003967 [Xylographa pallens]|nr:hypothetical protein [Xylographa pallens]
MKPRSLLGVAFVIFYVGPKRKHFIVHKELLVKALPHFSVAVSGRLSEGQQHEIYLKEKIYDPAIFEMVSRWLYKGAIPPIIRTEAMKGVGVNDMKEKCVLAAVIAYHRLYYMAEKWDSSSLRTAALDAIRSFHQTIGTGVHPSEIIEGFINTPEGSAMRKYLIDAGAYALRSSDAIDFLRILKATTGSGVKNVVLQILEQLILRGSYQHMGDPDKKQSVYYNE